MSLAEKVAAQAKAREVKTLIVDIERLPGRARVQHRGLTVEGDFWDLGGWKHTIGRRIHPDDVLEWPSTVCFAARWYETGKKEFHAAWDDGADAMHQRAFDLYDQADLVMTYNGVSFDNSHFMSGWLERGMGRPSPWKDIDLLKVVRSKPGPGWESKTLASVTTRLGIETKNDKYDVATARAAMSGDARAQRKLKRYNVNDVDILPAVYERLLPLIKSHPHVAPVRGEDVDLCPRCGSGDVTRDGTYSPGVYLYKSYKCNTCSGYFRTTYTGRGPSVRALS